jgi:hypothetical protein
MAPSPRTLQILTLLPTGVHVEQEVAARLEGAGVLGGWAVLTIAAFEQKLAAEVLGPGSRVSELTARLLVRRVLRDSYPDDRAGYFAPLGHSAPFADRLRDLFGQLARGLVTPGQLAALDASRFDARLAAKVRELARLYADYEARLDRLERGDPAACRRRLVTVLGGLEAPPRLLQKLERIVAFDRDRWLPSDAALLAAVARFVPVEVHLPAPVPGRERLFALVTHSGDALTRAAERARTPLTVTRERLGCGGPDAAGLLAALCERLFPPADAPDQPGPLAVGEALGFVEAPGRREEVGAVVREVRRALEAGTPLGAIAVVARDLDRYGRLLAEALERAQVPFRFRRGTRLLETPPVRAALAILGLPARRFDLDGILGVFGGSYTSLDEAEPGRLDQVLNDAGLLEGPPAAYAATLDALAAALEAEGQPQEAAEARAVRALLIPALEEVASLDHEGTLAEHAARADRLFENRGLVERARSGDDRRQRQDAAALAGLREALDALRIAEVEFGEAVSLSFDAFRELLAAALAEAFVEPPGSRPVEAVQVLAATDLAGLRFDLVCLLGLVEGEFPRRAPAGAILHEREVDALALALAPCGPFETPAQARLAEPFHLYRVLTAARRRLVLSTPAEDERGQPLLYSGFLEEIARAVDPGARGRHPHQDPLAALRTAGVHLPVGRRPMPVRFADCLAPADAEARLAWLGAGLPQVTAARRREAQAAEGIDPDALEAALSAIPEVAARFEARRAAARLAAARDRFFAEVPGERRTALIGPSTGALESAAARETLRAALAPNGEIHLSASGLESHAQCAFQWFLRYGVRLDPVERPRRDLEPHQTGDLLHQALERGYRACAEAGLTPIGGPHDPEGRAAEALMLAKAEEVLESWEGFRPGVPGAVREAEAERVRLLVRAFVEDEAARVSEGFVPVAFEHRFGLRRDGSPGDAGPLRIPLGDGVTAVLRGAIDRVDAAPDRLRVVDYKRSSRGDDYEALLAPEALGVRSFQMPIYLLAAEALREAEPHRFPPGELTGREAAYHLLKKRPDLRRQALDDAGYFALDPGTRAARREAGLPNFASQLEDRVRRALGGPYEITPNPDCGFCPYGAVCRVVTPLPVELP